MEQDFHGDFQVNVTWFFASFSGDLDWIVLILVWFERSLHSAQVSKESCPWMLKLMTSQRIERTWIGTGDYGWFRGEWVNKPAMCKISHSLFFSIMLFVLPFRTEHSTYFILSKVCHFVDTLKHNNIIIFVTREQISPVLWEYAGTDLKRICHIWQQFQRTERAQKTNHQNPWHNK